MRTPPKQAASAAALRGVARSSAGERRSAESRRRRQNKARLPGPPASLRHQPLQQRQPAVRCAPPHGLERQRGCPPQRDTPGSARAPVPPSPTRMSLKLGTPAGTFMPGSACAGGEREAKHVPSFAPLCGKDAALRVRERSRERRLKRYAASVRPSEFRW